MENEEQPQNWKPKGGRPRMKEEEKRRKTTGIRLTDDERKVLEDRAAAAGYHDLSAYLRLRLLAEDAVPPQNPKKLFQAIDQTGTALKRIGNNINQIARYVHYLEKHNMVEPKVIAEYNQYFGELIKVEEAYVKAIRAYLRTVR